MLKTANIQYKLEWLIYILSYTILYIILHNIVGLYYEDSEIVTAHFNKRFAYFDIPSPIHTNEDYMTFGILKLLNQYVPNIDWFAFNRVFRSIIGFSTITFLLCIDKKNYTKIFINLCFLFLFYDSLIFINNVRISGILCLALILIVIKGKGVFTNKNYKIIIISFALVALTTRVEVPLIYLTLFIILNFIINKCFNYTLIKLNFFFLIASLSYHSINYCTNIDSPKKEFIHEKLIDDTSYLDQYLNANINIPSVQTILKAKKLFILDKDIMDLSIESVLDKYSLSTFYNENIYYLFSKFTHSLIEYFSYNPYLIYSCIFTLIIIFIFKIINLIQVFSIIIIFIAFHFCLSLITIPSPRIYAPSFIIFISIVLTQILKLKQFHGYLILLIFIGIMGIHHINKTELIIQKDTYKSYEKNYNIHEKYRANNKKVYLGNLFFVGFLSNKLFEEKTPYMEFVNYGGLDNDNSFKILYKMEYGDDYIDIENRFKYIIKNNGVIVLNQELLFFYKEYFRTIKNIDLSFECLECLNYKDFCLYQSKFKK